MNTTKQYRDQQEAKQLQSRITSFVKWVRPQNLWVTVNG